jgi:hypothetical protein
MRSRASGFSVAAGFILPRLQLKRKSHVDTRCCERMAADKNWPYCYGTAKPKYGGKIRLSKLLSKAWPGRRVRVDAKRSATLY